MKKKIGIVVAITVGMLVLTILLLGIITYGIDAKKVAKGEAPQFCFKVEQVNDGGTLIYTGLGYKVIDYHKANGYDKMKLGSWFLNYEEHLGENFQKQDLAKYGELEVSDTKNIEKLLQELMYADSITRIDYPKSIQPGIWIDYDKELSKEQLAYNSQALFTIIPTLKTIQYHVKPEQAIFVRREEYDTSVAKVSFKGTVISSAGIFEQENRVEDGYAGKIRLVIQPDEEESVRRSSDKIIISLEDDQGEAWDAGTRVEVLCTDLILETYPAQMDCLSIKTIGESKPVSMYKKMIEELIRTDVALNADAHYIAVDLDNFLTFRVDEKNQNGGFLRALSKNEKQAIIKYLQDTYQKEVKVASLKQLAEQGLVINKSGIEGIAIYAQEIQEMTQNKVVISMAKYRSSLGAIFPTYELTYEQENGWQLKTLKMAIS